MPGTPDIRYEIPVDTHIEAMSRAMYLQDGWEKFWKYENMPERLQPKYWLAAGDNYLVESFDDEIDE